MLMTTFNYATTANYSWIFVEGLYLHTLLFLAVFSESSSVVGYIVFGWGNYSHCCWSDCYIYTSLPLFPLSLPSSHFLLLPSFSLSRSLSSTLHLFLSSSFSPSRPSRLSSLPPLLSPPLLHFFISPLLTFLYFLSISSLP